MLTVESIDLSKRLRVWKRLNWEQLSTEQCWQHALLLSQLSKHVDYAFYLRTEKKSLTEKR